MQFIAIVNRNQQLLEEENQREADLEALQHSSVTEEQELRLRLGPRSTTSVQRSTDINHTSSEATHLGDKQQETDMYQENDDDMTSEALNQASGHQENQEDEGNDGDDEDIDTRKERDSDEVEEVSGTFTGNGVSYIF